MSNTDAGTSAPNSTVSLRSRWSRHGHRGGVLWLTGLSGSGKSTLATAAENELFDRGYQVFVLDGDNLRHGMNGDLGFSDEDRQENIRRVTQVAAAYAEAGMVVISAFISPFRKDREAARQVIGDGFHEVFMEASLDVCEERDPKGLYRQARAGKISDFTGIDSPYEPPLEPELVIHSGTEPLEKCLRAITRYAEKHFAWPSGDGT